MALEDAMYLAKLLRESNGTPIEQVFAAFEQHRRPRTDKVIALGRRNGQHKQRMSPVRVLDQAADHPHLRPTHPPEEAGLAPQL